MRRAVPFPVHPAARPEDTGPDRKQRLLILGGTGLVALVLGRVFPLSITSNGISFLVHELGHTVVSIFFGSFAVPAVVLTVTFEQTLPSVLAFLRGRRETEPIL